MIKKKEGLEKSRFLILVGMICIIGGFYVNNVDSGRILLEVVGFVSLLMGIMAYKRVKGITLLLYAFLLLIALIGLDYGISYTLKKAPVFATSKKEGMVTIYHGLFYDAWQCGEANKDVTVKTKGNGYTCPISEIDALEKKIKELENQLIGKEESISCSLTRTYALTKKLGIIDQTGNNEYVILTAYQADPILGFISKADLSKLDEGKNYEFILAGKHPAGTVNRDDVFKYFSINIISGTDKVGLDQIQDSICK